MAQPLLDGRASDGPALRLSWPAADGDYVVETSPNLGSGAAWTLLGEAPTEDGGRWQLGVAAGDEARFFRLRRKDQVPPNRIVETSPAMGEDGVAVTREAIFRLGTPLGPGVTPGGADLFAEVGTRRALARAELGSDRRTLTLFFLENLPGSTRVRVTLDGTRLVDVTGRAVDADGDGKAGGVRVLEFDTARVAGLAGTGVRGRVLASEKNPDGSNRLLANVTVTVDGAEETLRAVTGPDGTFVLSPAPAGRFFVHVDGRTAVGSAWPGGGYYPFVGKAWEASAGATNLAGGTGEIFLPWIQPEALQSVSAVAETRVTFSPSVVSANPALSGVEVVVPANSLFSDSGVRGGRVGIAPVAPDRLPEPLPAGLHLPLVITVQTDGASNFDRPVPVRFPNLPDPLTGRLLAPGAKTVLWSFNHDTGRWEPQGTATISADGRFAVSDPGVGIRQPGWHGVAPGSVGSSNPTTPPPNDSTPGCQTCPKCDGDQKLKVQFALVDTATDMALLPLDLAPPLGCATGFALSGVRSSRDCLFLDVDECPTSLRNNLISASVGCIPVFGSLLGTALSSGQTANEIDKYMDNCFRRQSTPEQGRAAAPAADPSFRQDLERALDLLDRQAEVSEALADLNALLLGSPAWRMVDWQASAGEYTGLLQAVRLAVAPEGAQGEAISAGERTAILGLPRPRGIGPEDVVALVDRFAGLVPLGVTLPPTAANRAVFDRAAGLLEAAYASGWRSPNDGLLQALILLGRWFEPYPPGTLLLGSGGDPASEVFPGGRHHYLVVNLETGFAVRGRTTPQGAIPELILAPDTRYSVSYYQPASAGGAGLPAREARYGHAIFNSQAAGVPTRIPYAPMRPDGTRDLDADGLSDVAERILGTSVTRADSDADGTRDSEELAAGTDPLDGVGLPVGIVSVTAAPGTAYDVAAGNDLAVVAASQGLAVYDVSRPTSPVQLAVVPGSASAVARQGNRSLAAFQDGVRLIDLTEPSRPRTVWHRADLGGARGVDLDGRWAYVGKGRDLHRLDLATGDGTSLSGAIPTAIDSVAVRGDQVYVLGEGWLGVCRSADFLESMNRVAAPGSGGAGGRPRRLFVDADRLYAQHSSGFNVFDLAEPSAPVLVVDRQTTQFGWRQLVPTGTGLALAADGPNSTADGPHDVSLYRLTSAGQEAAFLSTFVTPGSAYAVSLAGARGFVADGEAGLVVINYLAPDLGGVSPVAVVSVDSVVPPRLEGGSTLRVAALVNDDVAVRQVEFLVNGRVAARDDSYPFEVFLPVPPVSPANPEWAIRVRAVDLAGNVGLSPVTTLPIVADATPPGILVLDPAPRASIPPASVREIRVSFSEPVASAVSGASLTLRASGSDGLWDTADDVPWTGEVEWVAAERALVLRLPEWLLSGKFRATLAAGLADAAGNGRLRPLVWEFAVGDPPVVTSVFPPSNFVRVGGTLDELVFIYNQPVASTLLDTFAWTVVYRAIQPPDGNFGPPVTVSPIQVLRSPDRRSVSLRTTGNFAPGYYLVSGQGPFLNPVRWEFYFRDVPNEVVGVNPWAGALWKHPPGVGVDDELVINLPGEVVPVSVNRVRSVLAYTEARLEGQQVELPTVLRFLGGLQVSGTTFGSGVTEVSGPVWLNGGVFAPVRIGAHVLNLRGGGWSGATVEMFDPAGVVANHPGSRLVLTNEATFRSSGGTPGRFLNAGTLHSAAPEGGVRFEEVPLQNEGRLEAAAGILRVGNLQNEGVAEVAAGAILRLAGRSRSGLTSTFTGGGALEFGELLPGTQRVQTSADAELRGGVEVRGPIRLWSGTVTLARPWVRPQGGLEVRNSSVLRLQAPARLGGVTVGEGRVEMAGESEIGALVVEAAAELRATGRLRVTGEARLAQGLRAFGPGVVEFAGTTVLTNGSQSGGVFVGNATLRNAGLWRQAIASSQGSLWGRIPEDGQPGTGAFENTGTFEQVGNWPLLIQLPFRNAGRVVLGRGPVSFDARNSGFGARAGAYRPLPGAELVLQDTSVQYSQAGTLDLAAGTVTGTGSIVALSFDPPARVINRGVLRPGNPAGVLTITAADGFEQTPSGELVARIGPAGSSLLRVDRGVTRLGGRLRVERVDGFAPVAGQSHLVLNAAELEGQFESTVLPDLGAGLAWEVAREAAGVVVRVVAR